VDVGADHFPRGKKLRMPRSDCWKSFHLSWLEPVDEAEFSGNFNRFFSLKGGFPAFFRTKTEKYLKKITKNEIGTIIAFNSMLYVPRRK